MVVAFVGANTTGNGATGAANAGAGAPTATLTTAAADSWVWGVGNDWDKAIPRTAGSGQAKFDEFLSTATGDTEWVQNQTALSGSAGSMVTVNDTAPTTDRWNLALIEVLSGTSTSDGGAANDAGDAAQNKIDAANDATASGPLDAADASGKDAAADVGQDTAPDASQDATDGRDAGQDASKDADSGNAADSGNVIFFDDFNGTSLGSAWTAMNRAGDYSNGEHECYLPSHVSVGGGNLSITTAAQNFTCGDETHGASQFPFVSGMVQWSSFNFLYGTVEVRAKTAGGRGSWPAVWMLGSQCQTSNVTTADNVGTCNWPNSGSDEVDILEVLQNNFTTAWHNIFTAATSGSCQDSVTDTNANFHIYTMHWAPGTLSFSVDGQGTCVLQNAPSAPMFLIINNAIGNWAYVASDFPQVQQIDYVKVTQP